jgi:hypothetical protein
VPRAHVEALIAAGHSMCVVDAGPPGTGTIRIDHDSDLVVTKLHLGRTALARVDLEVTVLAHDVTKVMKDVLVDPNDGIIYGLCERPLAELAYGAGRTLTRVRRPDGAREVIAEWDLAPATP